jgi:Xaa-Pro aminopeptidase
MRRLRLWDALREQVGDDQLPDWILIADPQHLMYLANFWSSPFVFRSANAAAMLILGQDGSSILVVDTMQRNFAAEAHVQQVSAYPWYDGKHTAPIRQEALIRAVQQQLDELPGENFAAELWHVPATVIAHVRDQRPGVRFVAVEPLLHEIKRRKDPDELLLLRRSLAAIDAGHTAALREVRPGMSEFDVYRLVQDAALKELGEPARVYGDFSSGPRTETGGGPPTQRIVEAGDLVLLDFSVVVYGYRGDTASTFVCAGQPTARQRVLYDACLEAMSAGEQLLRPGQACRDVDRAIRDSMKARGLEENFTSHSGHGLGLGHPDPPYIVRDSDDILLEDDVVTLEPGQFLAGVGGMRFEHNYRITDSGFETLSRHKLQLEQSG